MIGPLVNSSFVIFGAISGSLCGQILTPECRQKLNYMFGCIALGIGVTMAAKGNSVPPVVLSLLFGTLLGEICRLEAGVMKLAFGFVALLRRGKQTLSSVQEVAFRDQFAVATIIFCVSGLGIIGAMREGMTGDPSLLIVKGLLDLFTAVIFAANVGGFIGVLALPQFLIQTALMLTASVLVPLTTPAMLADFSACGGFIMMGAALRQFGLVQVPILGMLPGLFLVMPVSALWSRFFTF